MESPEHATRVGARIVRQVRRGSGLTQRVVSRRARVPQSVIARAETGGRDLTSSSLDRIVRAAGYQLTAIPTLRVTAAETADLTSRDLHAGHLDAAYRNVIQLADDLAAEHGALRLALTICPPPPTGDTRFDAWIAGLVEWRLDTEGLAHPPWLAAAPSLGEYWWIDEFTAGDESVIEATPDPLRARGVIIDEAELTSV